MPLKIIKESSPSDKHSCNVSVLVNLNDRVISGSDDGKMKVWSPDLKLLSEADASQHGAIISLAAGPDALYTITSDGTIQSWNPQTLQNTGEIKSGLLAPQKLFYEPVTNILWVGDSQGRVGKFENGKETGVFDLTEEVWDLYVSSSPVLVFTARDRDVLISEIVKGNLRSTAIVKATVKGRYPLVIVDDLFCCLDREGRQIQVHDNNVDNKFKLLREIPAAEMIINAVCRGDGTTVYAGGYDNAVGLWDVKSAQKLGTIGLESCVNVLATAEKGAYVALSDGRVLLLGNEV